MPALSLDTPSPARKPTGSAGVRWVDGPLRSTQRGLGEPFEIKVYEIDDVERLQRRRGGSSKVSHLLPTGRQSPSTPTPGRGLGSEGVLRPGGPPQQASEVGGRSQPWPGTGLWPREAGSGRGFSGSSCISEVPATVLGWLV